MTGLRLGSTVIFVGESGERTALVIGIYDRPNGIVNLAVFEPPSPPANLMAVVEATRITSVGPAAADRRMVEALQGSGGGSQSTSSSLVPQNVPSNESIYGVADGASLDTTPMNESTNNVTTGSVGFRGSFYSETLEVGTWHWPEYGVN